MSKKEMVAMLLAGGQGNRLYVLTKALAKPALPFGGKYRIIDFPLSNCTNSGIDTVGVLTQYQPLELNAYIGSGQPWDMDRMDGGVHILPPYTGGQAGWYKGTANAIYQNIPFIEQYDPDYVLILSGDHVYKMDYDKMLSFHKEKNADVTIAVLEVPMEEANRFGIMNANDDGTVYEFEEKPENPKSNKASMGVYIFSWDKLKEYLIRDEDNKDSSNDFGKDIIPSMLCDGNKMYAYPFNGYWKDVGTINSLWEANMDLLNPNINLNLSDSLWRIYARNFGSIPQFIGENADISESMISEGCSINGRVWYSVLFSGVCVGQGTSVNSSVIMKNVTIGNNVTINYAIIADGAVIEDNAIIGKSPEECENGEWGIAVVGSNAIVKNGEIILPKQMVEIGANK